jgi:hypothetical protein
MFKEGWNGLSKQVVGNVQTRLKRVVIGRDFWKRSQKAGTSHQNGLSETFKEGCDKSLERVVANVEKKIGRVVKNVQRWLGRVLGRGRWKRSMKAGMGHPYGLVQRRLGCVAGTGRQKCSKKARMGCPNRLSETFKEG